MRSIRFDELKRVWMMRSLLTAAYMLIGISASFAQETGDPKLGLEVATEACASCHAILRVEDRSRNPNAPPFAEIANVPGMTAMALQVALQSPHKTMPNLMLEADKLRNLIAY